MQHRIARGRTTSRKLKIETAVRQISITAYETPERRIRFRIPHKGHSNVILHISRLEIES